jgi:hypothetical protein
MSELLWFLVAVVLHFAITRHLRRRLRIEERLI